MRPGGPSSCPLSTCSATVEDDGSKLDRPSHVSLARGEAIPSLTGYKMVSVFPVLLVWVMGIVGKAMVILVG